MLQRALGSFKDFQSGLRGGFQRRFGSAQLNSKRSWNIYTINVLGKILREKGSYEFQWVSDNFKKWDMQCSGRKRSDFKKVPGKFQMSLRGFTVDFIRFQ